MNARKLLSIIAVVVGSLMSQPKASAQITPISFSFHGIVDQAYSPGGFSLGSSLVGSLSFLSNFALSEGGVSSNPTMGGYNVLFESGDYGLRLSATNSLGFTESWYTPISPIIRIQNGPSGDYVTFFGESFNGAGNLSLTFADPSGITLNNANFTFDIFRATTWQSVTITENIYTMPSWHAVVSIPDKGPSAIELSVGVLLILVGRRKLRHAT